MSFFNPSIKSQENSTKHYLDNNNSEGIANKKQRYISAQDLFKEMQQYMQNTSSEIKKIKVADPNKANLLEESHQKAFDFFQKIRDLALPLLQESENINNNNVDVNNNNAAAPAFRLDQLYQALEKEVHENQQCLPLFLEPLLKSPNDLQTFLEFLNSNSCSSIYYLVLLKKAYQQANLAIFIQILNYISSNHPKMLSEIRFQNLFEKVFNQKEWSDCKLTIVGLENKTIEIFILRSLLAASSQYFQALFMNTNFREKNTHDIQLNWEEFGIDIDKALAIVKFLYNGKIIVNDEVDASNYFKCAHGLQIIPLIEVCDQWILNYRDWDEENIIDIYKLGKDFGSRTWMQAALSKAAMTILMNPSVKRNIAEQENNNSQENKIQQFVHTHALEVEELNIDFPRYIPENDTYEILNTICKIFTNLKKINLQHCYHKNINVLGNLKKLESLIIGSLKDSRKDVFKFVRSLKALKVIDLNIGSSMTPFAFLGCLKGLSNLENLTLSFHEKLGAKTLNKLDKLPQLRHLHLAGDVTREKVVTPLPTNLVNLEYLSIPRHLTNEEINMIRNLQCLTDLYLKNCDDALLAGLALAFKINQESKKQSNKKEKIQRLQRLTIDSLELRPSSMNYLTDFADLKQLKITTPNALEGTADVVSHTTAALLAEIPYLEDLDIALGRDSQWLELWIKELEKRGKLDQIQSLAIKCNFNSSSEEIFRIISKLTNLKKLRMENWAQRNTINLHNLFDSLNLEEIEINLHNEILTPNALANIHKCFPYLKTFKIQNSHYSPSFSFNKGYWTISADGSNDISTFPKIEALNLCRINKDFQSTSKDQKKQMIAALIQRDGLRHLEVLSFNERSTPFQYHKFGTTDSKNDSLFDQEDLMNILTKAPNLRELYIKDLQNAKADDLLRLIIQLKKLENLIFNDCYFSDLAEMSQNSYDLLRMPSLKKVIINNIPIDLIEFHKEDTNNNGNFTFMIPQSLNMSASKGFD